MLAIAGQIAGPNWLSFLREPMGFTGCINKVFKNGKFSFKTIKDFKIYFLRLNFFPKVLRTMFNGKKASFKT